MPCNLVCDLYPLHEIRKEALQFHSYYSASPTPTISEEKKINKGIT